MLDLQTIASRVLREIDECVKLQSPTCRFGERLPDDWKGQALSEMRNALVAPYEHEALDYDARGRVTRRVIVVAEDERGCLVYDPTDEGDFALAHRGDEFTISGPRGDAVRVFLTR